MAALMMAAGSVHAAQADNSQKKTDDQDDVLTLPSISVIAEAVDSENVGKSTLNQDQISTRQASTVQELVDELPGVSMEGSARVGGQSINIQGFGGLSKNEHVQIYLDGAPKKFRKYMQGTLFIEPELLKTVDVEKGAHSASRGNGGFGGAVLMETKDAKDMLQNGQTVGGMVKAGFGTNNHAEVYSGSVYAADSDNPFDVLLNVTKRRAGNIRDAEGNAYNYSGMSFLSGLAKLGWTFDEGHKVTLTQINGQDASRAPYANKRGIFETAELRKTVWRETDDSNTIFKHEYTSPTKEWLNTTFQLSHTTTKQHDTRPENSSKMTMSNLGIESWTTFKLWQAEFKNNQFIDWGDFSHDLTYGIQFQQEKQNSLARADRKTSFKCWDGVIVSSGRSCPNKAPAGTRSGEWLWEQYTAEPYFMPDGTQTVFAGFIEDAITWDNLTVTPALRYERITNKGVPNSEPDFNNPANNHDYSAQTYQGFSPKLSAFYQLTPETSFFASYSYAMKAPTVREQYSLNTTSYATSRLLKPEKVYAARLGVLTNYSGLLDRQDNLQVRVSLFDTRVKDNIYRARSKHIVTEPQKSSFVNHRGYYIQGLEAELYYDASRVFGSLNIAMMKSKYYGTPLDPNGYDLPVEEVGPPEVNMSLGYKLYEKDMRFGWKGKYVHKTGRTARDLDPKASLYTTHRGTQSYMLNSLFWDWEPRQVDGLKLQVFVENIFNRHYRSYMSESLPGKGRNVKLSATMKF